MDLHSLLLPDGNAATTPRPVLPGRSTAEGGSAPTFAEIALGAAAEPSLSSPEGVPQATEVALPAVPLPGASGGDPGGRGMPPELRLGAAEIAAPPPGAAAAALPPGATVAAGLPGETAAAPPPTGRVSGPDLTAAGRLAANSARGAAVAPPQPSERPVVLPVSPRLAQGLSDAPAPPVAAQTEAARPAVVDGPQSRPVGPGPSDTLPPLPPPADRAHSLRDAVSPDARRPAAGPAPGSAGAVLVAQAGVAGPALARPELRPAGPGEQGRNTSLPGSWPDRPQPESRPHTLPASRADTAPFAPKAPEAPPAPGVRQRAEFAAEGPRLSVPARSGEAQETPRDSLRPTVVAAETARQDARFAAGPRQAARPVALPPALPLARASGLTPQHLPEPPAVSRTIEFAHPGADPTPDARPPPSASVSVPAAPAPSPSVPAAPEAETGPRGRESTAPTRGEVSVDTPPPQFAHTTRTAPVATTSLAAASKLLANPQIAPRDSRSDAVVAESAWSGADPLAGEMRAADTAPRAGMTQPVQAAPELARPALMQIAEAMRGGQSVIDVMLSPEELGRVRLSLGAQDGVLNVVVQAERPETAELIRRNLGILLAEARHAGFEDVNFGFGGSDTGAGSGRDHPGGGASPPAPPHRSEAPENAPAPMRLAASGLDLRL